METTNGADQPAGIRVVDKIVRYMKYNKLSQKALAARLGVTPQYVNKLLRSRGQDIKISTALRYGRILGLDLVSVPAPDLSRFGTVVPAEAANSFALPSFEVRVVAGFPVPLDNDEKSQDIDILRLLCPHPESSYLIRVQGESMIDAGIMNGDIVIVDKSRRDPSEKDIAVCELNGEYTIKRVALESDGSRFLVPANPEFPRMPIKPGDSFSVWGIVTYVIHKARG